MCTKFQLILARSETVTRFLAQYTIPAAVEGKRNMTICLVTKKKKEAVCDSMHFGRGGGEGGGKGREEGGRCGGRERAQELH